MRSDLHFCIPSFAWSVYVRYERHPALYSCTHRQPSRYGRNSSRLAYALSSGSAELTRASNTTQNCAVQTMQRKLYSTMRQTESSLVALSLPCCQGKIYVAA